MFKKIIIVSLLLLAIFSISAVSAAENISDTTIENPEINEVLSVENKIEDNDVEDEDLSSDNVDDDLLSDESSEDKLGAHEESVLKGPSIESYISVSDTVHVDEYGYSDTVLYISNIYYYAEGTISIDIDGENVYSSSVSRYKYIYSEHLSKTPGYGMHNLTVSYKGSHYDSFTKTYQVYFTYPFNAYADYWDFSYFHVELPNSALNNTVNVQVNGKNLGNRPLDNYRRFYLDYENYNLGYNLITVSYEDSIHPKSSVDINYHVNPIFDVPSEYIIDDEEAAVTVTVPRHENGILVLYKVLREAQVPEVHVESVVPEVQVESEVPEVHIEPDNVLSSYREFLTSVPVVNGTASIKIPKSDQLQYYAAEFIGNERFDVNFNVEFISNNPSIIIDYLSEVTEGHNFKIQIENIADEMLNFNVYIDGQIALHSHYLLDNISISIPKLSVGTHEILIRSIDPYYENENHVHFYKKFNITVNEKEVVDDVNSTVGSQEDIIKNNDPNKDNNVEKSKKDNKPVKSNKIVVSLKKVKIKKSAKKLVITATLKVNGKLVKSKILTFKFNGKSYKVKLNSKGLAKLTIKKSVLKKLKVGKKVKYQVSYGKYVVKKTATVKK